LGALPVLAELVGPSGSVVGIDVNSAALAQARASLDRLGVRGVELVAADVNALEQTKALVWEQFDLAYCRAVLMHQSDPTATLRRIARLVRPGGRIVALDGLADPNYPYCVPPVPAVRRIRGLFDTLVDRKEGTLGVVRQYRRIRELAGLRLIEQRGSFWVPDDPREVLTWYRDFLLSMRGNLMAQNLASDAEIDALVQEINAAQDTVEFVAGILLVHMIAEVP
jgi:SAM-dependent methyltransferase